MRYTQLVAIMLAAAGVGVTVAFQGTVPWVSLGLALSSGPYGLVKKRIGGRVDALSGMTVESLLACPLALGYLGWLQAKGLAVLQGTQGNWLVAALLVLSGLVILVPLLLFAAGTARVALSVVELSQYVMPIIQFLLAWLVIGESISPVRWAAMVLVWLAVLVFAVDLTRQLSRRPYR